jgi:uracil-DNA glycosylase
MDICPLKLSLDPYSDPMNIDTFSAAFQDQIATTFQTHPALPDHRRDHPWLTGWLGNPFAGLWLVGEKPALGQVEKQTQRGWRTDPNAQWNSSAGDKLLRRTLVKVGFKSAPAEAPGGWEVYITNAVKSAHIVHEYRAQCRADVQQMEDIWASVLAWELKVTEPKLVVAMGKHAMSALVRLDREGAITLPRIRGRPSLVEVAHSAYIGQRADAKRRLGPMHPTRVAEYEKQFQEVAEIWQSLAQPGLTSA